MERADRARDLSDKRDTRVSSEIIRSSLFGMRYLSDKRDTIRKTHFSLALIKRT